MKYSWYNRTCYSTVLLQKTTATVDLNQVSSLPKVTTGSGATPTVWSQDAAEIASGVFLIASGTTYTHDEALFGHATTAVKGWTKSPDANVADTSSVTLGPWGMNLSDINALGGSYAAGDVFGTATQRFNSKSLSLPYQQAWKLITA